MPLLGHGAKNVLLTVTSSWIWLGMVGPEEVAKVVSLLVSCLQCICQPPLLLLMPA